MDVKPEATRRRESVSSQDSLEDITCDLEMNASVKEPKLPCELNISLSNETVVQRDKIIELFEKVQTSSHGVPQFKEPGSYLLSLNGQDCWFFEKSPNDIQQLVQENLKSLEFLRFTLVEQKYFDESLPFYLNRKKVICVR